MSYEITRDNPAAAAAVLAVQLRRQKEALAAYAERPPRVGETFLSRRTVDFAVEWLVVDEENGRLRVVPLDWHPFVGSRDLALENKSSAVLRCDLEAQIDATDLEGKLRTGKLADAEMDRLRAKRQALDASELEVTRLEEEMDADAEYRHWREHTLGPALAALQADPPATRPAFLTFAPKQAAPAPPAAWRTVGRRWWPVLAAASILMALVLPAAWQIQELHRQLAEERSRVVVNVPAIVLRAAARRQAGEPTVLTPGSAHRFTLSLEVAEPRNYRLEIVERVSGREIWSKSGLARTSGKGARKYLRLDFPTGLFASGEYELRISALDAESPNTFEKTYVVRLER